MTTHSQPVLPLYDPNRPGNLGEAPRPQQRMGAGGGTEQWVLQQLPYYEDQYTSMNCFDCCVTTFNAGCKPPPENLNEVLGRSFRAGSEETQPDILVVGLQEVDMSATALWKEETDVGQLWISRLRSAMGAEFPPLHPNAPCGGSGYYALPARQLVGLLTAVFVKKDVFAQGFKDYSISIVSTGAMGNLGNKGCVGVRFQFHMSSFCFLNCHLAAGQGNVSKRNDDVQNILGRIDFCGAGSSASVLASTSSSSSYGGGEPGVLPPVPTEELYSQVRFSEANSSNSKVANRGAGGPTSPAFAPNSASAFQETASSSTLGPRTAGGSIPPNASPPSSTYIRSSGDPSSPSTTVVGGGGVSRYMLLPTAKLQYLSASDHDVVVLFGDLNYRVDMSYEEAVSKAHNADFDGLIAKDQLLQEMRNPHTPYKGFTDHTPRAFMPTYRYDIGTLDTYDTSEKRRIPAYTDRILHWARNKRHRDVVLRQLEVRQHVVCSDHKPVVAFFSIPYRQMVAEQRMGVLERLRDKVREGGLDRVSAVKLALSSKALNFGTQTPYSDNDERKQTLICTNEGECVAVVRTSRMAVEGDESEGRWVRCNPRNFSILPGESKEVEVECILDDQSMDWQKKWSPYRGAATRDLKSMVIINVENGPLNAIECTVRVRPSVFYNSILNLVNLEDKACVDAYADGGLFINTDGSRSRTTSGAHNDPSGQGSSSGEQRADTMNDSDGFITINNGSVVGAQRVAIHTGPPPATQRMPTDSEVAAYRANHSPESVGERIKAESVEMAARLRQHLPRIPKEVWHLCDALLKRASYLKGVFSEDPDLTVVKAIMDHLDTAGDRPIPPDLAADSISVGYVLLELINTLADPVVPFALYTTALSASKYANKVPIYIVHEQLPTYHSNLFIYLVGFMRHVTKPQFSRMNELTAEGLAKAFAPAMIRRPAAGPGSALEDRRSGKSAGEIRAIAQGHSMDAVKFVHYFVKPTVLPL